MVSLLQVEHSRSYPILLSYTLLSLPVKIPDRLRQEPRYIRVLFLQRVPHGMARYKVALATLKGLRNAQQTYKIGVVGVEELPGVGPVDAHAVYGTGILAEILYVTQDMAVGVLRNEVAQISAQALQEIWCKQREPK